MKYRCGQGKASSCNDGMSRSAEHTFVRCTILYYITLHYIRRIYMQGKANMHNETA
jgi:hypothetical protein